MAQTDDIRAQIAQLREIAGKTIWLQGIGAVEGKPADQLKPGDVTIWNYGGTETVTGRLRATPTRITFSISYANGHGNIIESRRTLNRNKIVGLQTDGKITTYNITKEEHSRYRP